MATVTKFNDFSEQSARGVHDFDAHVFKVALTNTAPTAANTVTGFMTQILRASAKEKYVTHKQASANRNPRELGSAIKDAEVWYHHEVTNQHLWNKF